MKELTSKWLLLLQNFIAVYLINHSEFQKKKVENFNYGGKEFFLDVENVPKTMIH